MGVFAGDSMPCAACLPGGGRSYTALVRWRSWSGSTELVKISVTRRERRAQRGEAWGAGESSFFNGASDCCGYCGVFGVGKVNCRHGAGSEGARGAPL